MFDVIHRRTKRLHFAQLFVSFPRREMLSEDAECSIDVLHSVAFSFVSTLHGHRGRLRLRRLVVLIIGELRIQVILSVRFRIGIGRDKYQRAFLYRRRRRVGLDGRHTVVVQIHPVDGIFRLHQDAAAAAAAVIHRRQKTRQ